QTAPWFSFALHGRVPARGFSPMPSVDGGILEISRRKLPLVPASDRRAYERFVRRTFTARGRGLGQILRHSAELPREAVDSALRRAGVPGSALPRELDPAQWARLWSALTERR